jgi:hypothetical protein
MPIVPAMGCAGDSIALLGAPEHVLGPALDGDVGVTTLPLRRFDPLHDGTDSGRDLPLLLRTEIARCDRGAARGA